MKISIPKDCCDLWFGFIYQDLEAYSSQSLENGI